MNKKIRTLYAVLGVCLLASCAAGGPRAGSDKLNSAAESMPARSEQAHSADAQPLIIDTVEFHPGTSSATVEKLAASAGCKSNRGAGLITEKGPVEVYRVQCDNGRTFLARCELRQCRPMH